MAAESLVTFAFLASVTSAQTVRPGQERLPLPPFREEREPTVVLPDIPDFEPSPRAPGQTLPPIEKPTPSEREIPLPIGRRIRVETIDIRGNSVLDPTVLRDIAARWVGRDLAVSDLDALRDELTQAYVKRGFVTSGAVIPPQTVSHGVLIVDVVEGILADVEIETDGRFRTSHLRQRIARRRNAVVDVYALERRLQTLQQDDRVRSVEATLVPGERRGESILRVRFHERQPWHVAVSGDNYITPAIGEGRGSILLGYDNTVGVGDRVRVEYQGTRGLNDVRGSIEVPFTVWDTRIELHARRTWSEVVEHPFDDLDIKSQTETYGFTLTQPLWRTRSVLSDVFLTGEWRRSRSFLLGQPISFVPGPDEGVAKVAVARLGGNWLHRSPRHVVALRTMVSRGFHILDATVNDGAVPDGKFLAWLSQLQAAAELPWLGVQVIGTTSLQVASQPLLGLEQFAMGGRYTVRGYRESQVVRDQGVVGGVELRLPVPLPRIARWHPKLQIAPFVDAGRSWSKNRRTTGDQQLLSAGVGALVDWSERIHLELYWGQALEGVDHPPHRALQDRGLHLGFTLGLP